MFRMQKKTLAWWDSNNFGDALNPYIFWTFGVSASYEQANKSDALALGSLLERIFEGAHTKNETVFSEIPIDVLYTSKLKEVINVQKQYLK